MKRLGIVWVGLVLVLGVFVGAGMSIIKPADSYNSYLYDYQVELDLQEGWNLISYGENFPWYMSESYIDESLPIYQELMDYREIPGINRKKADAPLFVFVFDPFDKKYVELFPESELSEELDGLNSPLYNSAMWVYVKKETRVKYFVPNVPPLNEIKLYSGWNFLAITPEMIGKDIDGIKGDCEVTKLYHWSPREQSFINAINNFDEMTRDGENAGYGFIMKVSSDCTLGSSGGGASPPGLPEGDGECTDSDGGLDYYVKGTVIGQNEDAPVEEITSATDTCSGDTLYELVCKDSGKYDDESYVCPNGCSDGVCI